MRILHISTRLILGGSQENTVLSCEGQAELSHDVHLAFGPIFGPEGSLLERVQRFRASHGAGITTHEVPALVRQVAPLTDMRCLAQLRELVLTLRPDVVHTHSSKAGILGRIAAWQVKEKLGKPVAIVHTIHGPPFMPVEGGVGKQAARLLNNGVYTLAEYIAALHCHSIVSVADAMTQQYLNRGIGEPSLYTTVRSGMEVDDFLFAQPCEDRESMRAELGLGQDDYVIGTVARLAEHKGHGDLLSSFASLRAKGIRHGLHPVLLWVGDGWLREELVARAGVMGLVVREAGEARVLRQERVARADIVLTGLVPPARVPSLLRAMDVLAHPSSREGLPRTVPQALLAGVCPVAYDVDGTREACMEMQTGRLVEHGDVQSLAEAIGWCMSHREDAMELTRRGQEWAATEFAASTMVRRLEEVYERALQRAASL